MARNMYRFDGEAYNEWIENSHIPADVMEIVSAVAEKLGIYLEEEVITIRNRWGDICGYTKGFTFTNLTMSYAEGPTENAAPTFLKWVKGLDGFYVADEGNDGYDERQWECHAWISVGYSPCDTNDDFVHWTGTYEEREAYLDELEMEEEMY